MGPEHCAGVAQGMLPDRMGNGGGTRLGVVLLVVNSDLQQGFLDQGADPHANVGGHHVHQTKAGNHLESVDVQLEKEKRSGEEQRKREREIAIHA